MELAAMVEEKLNQYADRITEGGMQVDEHALGELTFYMALRRAVSGKATAQDLGMLDAVNDTLQELGLVDSATTFYKR